VDRYDTFDAVFNVTVGRHAVMPCRPHAVGGTACLTSAQSWCRLNSVELLIVLPSMMHQPRPIVWPYVAVDAVRGRCWYQRGPKHQQNTVYSLPFAQASAFTWLPLPQLVGVGPVTGLRGIRHRDTGSSLSFNFKLKRQDLRKRMPMSEI
jgi:hypothetical protein